MTTAPSAPAVAQVAVPQRTIPDRIAEPVSSGQAVARRRGHVRRLLVAADAAGAAVAAATAVAVQAWLHPGTSPWPRAELFGITFLVIVAVLTTRGVRRRQLSPRVADDIGFIVSSACLSGLVLLAVRAIPHLAPALPVPSVLLALGAAIVAVPVARAVAIVLMSRKPKNVARVAIVGSGFIAGYLTDRLARSPLVDVLGIVDDHAGRGQQTLGRFDDLPRLCRTLELDRVIIAFSERHPARTAEVVRAVRDVADVDVVVRFFEVAGWDSRLTDVTGLPLVTLGAPPSRAARAVKRAIDVAVSASGLVALSPVLAVVALAVKLESRGPVLFRQERVGQSQRPFRILKFRTMRPVDVPTGDPGSEGRGGNAACTVVRPVGVHARRRRRSAATPRTPFDTIPDPTRITAVGSILRRTGIDELPQLFNILRGEMALVGPRPFIAEECEALSGGVARRFDVRPGMTGMWQVCGQHELTFEELVRLDVQYATSWSIGSDLRILARTPGRLLRGSAPGR